MNKKISTLLAGAVLAVGSFSANAADKVPSLSLTADNGLVQIAIGGTGSPTDYLAIENDSLKLVPAASVQGDLFLNTLWCVEVESVNQGQAVKYTFINKATSQELSVSPDYLKNVNVTADLLVGGDIKGWAFSNNLGTLATDKPMYYYFNTDSVVAFTPGSANVDGTKGVKLTKYVAEYANAYASALQFSLVYADNMTLTANQINTILGTQTDAKFGVKLNFEPNKNKVNQVNYFTDDYFLADTVAATGDTDFVRILTKDSSYVYVDTAYINDNGERFLAFNTIGATAAKMKGKSIADSLGTALNDQSKFLFRYWPSKDSLVIQVKQSTQIDAVTDLFGTGATTTIDATGKNVAAYANYVTVQDLVKADEIRIVTIYNKKETEIKFGLGSCKVVGSHRIVIADGLYLIKNTLGQYLSMPIHGDSTVVWSTVEANVKPWDMPSFQWVIEKSGFGNKITNREFATKGQFNPIQFYDNANASILGASVKAEIGAGKALEKADSTIMKDKYLGYRFLDNDSLTVQTYKLKYWTSFSDKDLYMGAAKTGDSVIYIGAKDNYVIANTGAEAKYGYKGAVAGLTDLYRQAYTMKSKAADKFVVEAAENRYAVSENVAELAKFFYKANNNVEGTKYYALVDTAFTIAPDSLRKVGVDENNKFLKSQIMTETRTSAFTVEADNAPLYRRFNNAALGETDDKTDSLSFKETKRGEYLMDENNPEWLDKNEVVDYLGIWSPDKATGLSFQVDTAWVGRGLGYIKPQYLISVDHRYVPGTDSVACTYTHNHYDNEGNPVDNKHCSHATFGTPDYTVAKYLVSFQDSVNKVDGRDLPYTDVKGGYTRVGFVKAIHQGDTLYVLANGFEKLDYTKLSIAEIVKSYRAAGIYDDFVCPLTEDTHKNYTWSFRYTDPEAAATVTTEGKDNEFLIESMAYDGLDIAPENAAWIKMQNGCVVLTDDKSVFNNAKTGGDGALVFNVDPKVPADDMATDNETITTSEFSVIAGQGQVTIANAEGKKVIISNLLGQVVANTVITSDNATIAVPAGVVVVAVEGEAAAKVIVL